jgi:hypothetical protein
VHDIYRYNTTLQSVLYLQVQYNTTKCTIFTGTIQHYKVYYIYKYNTTLQIVRYLQIQYNTTKCTIFTDTIQHYKLYDIYRYNTALQTVRYLQIQYNTTNCTIFTDTIQHYKLYDIYRYNTTLQSVWYLQVQSAQSTLHNKLYDIYRYSQHSQLYTTNCTIFTGTVRTRQLLTANWRREAQSCLAAGSSGNSSVWQAIWLTRFSVKRSLDNRGSTYILARTHAVTHFVWPVKVFLTLNWKWAVSLTYYLFFVNLTFVCLILKDVFVWFFVSQEF